MLKIAFTRHRALLLSLLVVSAGGALAQTGGVDRARLRAETAAAVAAGQIPRGEAAAPLPAFQSLKSRTEVRAETSTAMAAGLIPRGELGAPVAAFEPVKTRAEVNAETRMAMRLQLIPRGEAPLREATAHELELIRLAGENARHAARTVAAR